MLLIVKTVWIVTKSLFIRVLTKFEHSDQYYLGSQAFSIDICGSKCEKFGNHCSKTYRIAALKDQDVTPLP